MNDTTQQPMTDEQFAALEQQFPDTMLVDQYLKIRKFMEDEAAVQAKHIEPWVAKQAALANELHRRLLARNPNWQPGVKASGSTENGTFFLKTDNSLKMADREAFYQWIVNVDSDDVNHAINTILERIRTYMTAHVAKEGVESYLDQIEQYRREHGGALPPGVTSALPPGISLERITKLQVRKL